MLFQQTQRRVEELSNLLELGQTALGNFDLHRILEAGARVAVRILRCTASYIWLPDPTGTMLRMEAFHDPDVPEGGAEGLVLPLSRRSMMTLAFATRQPPAGRDAQSDVPIDRDLVRRFPARSVLAVPLVSHDVSVGALALLTRGDRIFRAQGARLAPPAPHPRPPPRSSSAGRWRAQRGSPASGAARTSWRYCSRSPPPSPAGSTGRNSSS